MILQYVHVCVRVGWWVAGWLGLGGWSSSYWTRKKKNIFYLFMK